MIKHSGHIHLPEFAEAFFFPDIFDDCGFLPAARSNSATVISSSRVLRFGFRRWYSSLKAR
jgi:hypothetical protein